MNAGRERVMGDSYREIMVQPDTPSWKKMLKTAFPVLAVLCFLGAVFLMLWPLLIGTVGFILLAVFVNPRMDVEYEYLYVNGELDVDTIYSKQKRKKAGTYDIENLEILAPIRSHALDSYVNREGVKIKDYTSQKAPEKSYTLVFSKEGKQEIIKVELDDDIIADIRRIAPHKVNLV